MNSDFILLINSSTRPQAEFPSMSVYFSPPDDVSARQIWLHRSLANHMFEDHIKNMNATLTASDLLSLVRIVLRLSRAFHAALDEPLEQGLRLNIKELTVLAAITDGDQYPSLIAARHQLPAPTVTRLLGRLIELGLVRRVTEPDDLRKFRLELTDEGLRARRQTREDSERILHEVFGHLPPDRVRRAMKAVAELEDAVLAGTGTISPDPVAGSGSRSR